MTGPFTIDSAADPRLADYVGLTDAELRRRVEGGLFIAEGELVIRQLLKSTFPVRSVLVTPARYKSLEPALDGIAAPVYVAELDVMRDVAGFNIHRGALASADRVTLPRSAALLTTARRVVVLERLNDQENLGVMFRNAAAFAMDAVLLDPSCADPLYRRTVRVSLGHVLRVPYARFEAWPAGVAELRTAGFTVVALTPRTEAVAVSALDGLRSGKVALMLGAEGPGLSTAALDAADLLMRIPMAPGVDSLNVATAAAVAFHRLAPDGA